MFLTPRRCGRLRLSIVISAILALSFLSIFPPGLEPDADARARRTRVVPYRALLLIEAKTGRVLRAKNARLRARPASIVKMMTALIALERIKAGEARLDDIVTTSRRAARMGGQQVYLAQGEKFPLRDLLKSIIISSANDSAYAVAEHIAGGARAFVRLMNRRARALGMTDTRFVNVNGLPTRRGRPASRMSARDAGTLARELLKHPLALKWSATRRATFRGGEFILTNTNRLVGRVRGVDGLKTGYHKKAGFSVVATAKRGGLRLIAVVMGSSRSGRRFREARRLLAWGFRRYRWMDLGEHRGLEQRRIDVVRGEKEKIRVKVAGKAEALVRRGQRERIAMRAELPQTIPAPVRAGQKVGRVVYSLGGKKLAEAEVVAAESSREVGRLPSLLRLR